MTSIDDFLIDTSNNTESFDSKYKVLIQEISDMYPCTQEKQKSSENRNHTSDINCKNSVYRTIYEMLRIIIIVMFLLLFYFGICNIIKKMRC